MIGALRRGLKRAFAPDRGLLLPVLGFPIRVSHSFWLVAFVWGVQSRPRAGLVLEWVVVVGISVLVHELGHALVASRWGVVYKIELHGLGGATHWRSVTRLVWWQHAAISLAGPAAGFALALLAWLLPPVGPPVLWIAARDPLWVNVSWGLFNLLPVAPLDGGEAVRALSARLGESRSEWWTAAIGVATALVAGIVAIGLEQPWAILILGIHGFSNFMVLKSHYDMNRRTDWQPAVDRTRDRY